MRLLLQLHHFDFLFSFRRASHPHRGARGQRGDARRRGKAGDLAGAVAVVVGVHDAEEGLLELELDVHEARPAVQGGVGLVEQDVGRDGVELCDGAVEGPEGGQALLLVRVVDGQGLLLVVGGAGLLLGQGGREEQHKGAQDTHGLFMEGRGYAMINAYSTMINTKAR